MGDLNCDMIATRYDNDTCKLMSVTDVYGLQQLITEPTRVTPTSSTLIDVIYTNCPDKIVCSGVCHVSISDHSMVFAYRKLSINGHNTLTYRKFGKFNRTNFRNDIASQNRPFPSSRLPPLQSESKCEVFLMKISFHSYVK